MLYKFHYISRKDKNKVFNALVRYEGEKYNKYILYASLYPILKIKYIAERIEYIHSCTDEDLKDVNKGDSFIMTRDNLDSFMVINLFEWKSEEDGKHYHFDIYHNYDNDMPNTTLIKIN